MVKVDASDARNYFLLTEGYLPAIPVFEAALPRTPKFLRLITEPFGSRDEAAARTLNLHARRAAYFQRQSFASLAQAMRVPLQTWVIGPGPSDSAFAAWFAGEPADTSYRLLLHHLPRIYERLEVPPLWHMVHADLLRRRQIQLRHRPHKRALQESAKPQLARILAAYQRGVVENELDQTGHSYIHFSLGIP